MTALDLVDELAFAVGLADLADRITLPVYEGRAFAVDRKADRSEVTEADRDAEASLRAAVHARFGDHGFIGEEAGRSGNLSSPWQWIVDPVDGTSNFVRGIPVWATLIALTHCDHGPVVGVVSAPAMQRRWWASLSQGSHVAGRQLQVSTVGTLADAQVSVTHSSGWDDLGLTPRLVAVQQAAGRARGFGDFWQHMLVAEGGVDVAIDAIGLQPYDLAAVQLIVTEAGGTFTDRLGEATFEHDSAISSNGLLHDQVLAQINATG